MAVHVECVGRTEYGLIYSVAHYYNYYEAAGDLVADPEMELLRDESARVERSEGRCESFRPSLEGVRRRSQPRSGTLLRLSPGRELGGSPARRNDGVSSSTQVGTEDHCHRIAD